MLQKRMRLIRDGRSSPSLEGWAKVALIRAKSMINPSVIDLESLFALSRNNKLKVIQGWISNYIGAILMNLDNGYLPEAQAWIQKGIEEDQRNGMRFCLGRDYALYAEWFKRNGDRSVARENLGRAIEIMKECGADGWVEKYEKELAALW